MLRAIGRIASLKWQIRRLVREPGSIYSAFTSKQFPLEEAPRGLTASGSVPFDSIFPFPTRLRAIERSHPCACFVKWPALKSTEICCS
jgi:hypothetical protein